MRIGLAAAAFWLGIIGAAAPSLAAAADKIKEEAEATAPSSAAAADLAAWIRASGDNRGLPFAIVDKATAEVIIYAPEGELIGSTTALIGAAFGDDSVPGIGDRELRDIAPEERTTPAGRFMAAYGPAVGRKKVLWVDYATAVSLHPVVTSNPKERRMQRLRSPEIDDNRITYGCINVAPAFYKQVVRPTFSGQGGVFYVLPETRTIAEVFPAYHTPRHASAKAKSRAGDERRRRARDAEIAEPSDERWQGPRSVKALFGRWGR
ncbi:L,D-transpeptidase [Phenylobacterium sp.]|jgi:hypothetical protein|uniref:L,D-transpeptidase n=1 Tax=Phenylobacterium sp. TaxID=1871053 RepID=UPI002E326E73|nr:L,D-transpeptidase [Phenylobacterium sp.]HEX2559186.1 L,D-transpeptidase [Phenylobacterium sp.]